MKKLCVLLLILFILPLGLAELDIEKEAVVSTVIPELDKPAIFDLEITNLEDDDVFEIYSLVGVTLKPEEPFEIKSGVTKHLRVEAWPSESILETSGTFNFVYKIKGEESGIQEDLMSIRVINLDNAFDINSYNINLESERAIIYIKNRADLDFPVINARFASDFFDIDKTFSLDSYEKKEFEVLLDKEEMKNLIAGQYPISIELETYGVNASTENYFRFTEKADISTSETKGGFIIYRTTVEKINEGNLPFVVQVRLRKNAISRLFTTFNVEPVSSVREGFFVTYTFQKEIMPAETFTVRATTNWLFPLILIAALVIIAILLKNYASTHIILRKKSTFVKAKGGEFALKITLTAKAKSFTEKIRVMDKIPAIVKVHKRFGTIEPDKIDEKNRRLEWNIDSLQAGEERIFSYVIYSKVAPVGKFELPTATAVYEKDGKLHEAESNRVFFLTEPKR